MLPPDIEMEGVQHVPEAIHGGPLPLTTAAEPSALGRVRFGKWAIEYDPPPIPARNCDWGFTHDNYDASWEGEEDGWVSNGLGGYGASVEDCKAQIREIEEDRNMPLTEGQP